jgi:simple sugar transport system permease protein
VQRAFKKLLSRHETYISVVIFLLALLIQFRSGQFFTPNNLVDLASALVVPGLFGLAAFMVIASGGIDVSFPSLASLSIYATTKLLLDQDYQGGILLPTVMVLVFGAVLGAVNGFLIAHFKLPTLIVTLGTSSVFRGVMQGALNSQQLAVIPPGMSGFGKSALFIAQNQVSGLTSRMPSAMLFLLAALVITWFILRYTMMGRGLFAIGGNEISAHRAGFNVKRIKFLLYVFVGMISSLAGLVRVCMMTQCHPTNMLGMELMVIAGVVLGGTAITGGKGTLLGCMMGTILIVIVSNSLILLGIPTVWQGFFLGVLIIVGTGISMFQVTRMPGRASAKALREASGL